MRTRRQNVQGAVPDSSSSTRNLRPRQARGTRGVPPGGTVPRAGGRVTRSSAALAPTNPTNSDISAPQLPSLGSATRSHKRSLSPGAAPNRPKRTRPASHLPGFYEEDLDSESGDELGENPYITPGSDVEQEAAARQRQPRARKSVSPKKSTGSPARSSKGSPGRLATKKVSVSEDTEAPAQDAVILPWASLPYHVLVQVFRYASAPLNEVEQAKWLLAAASGVCRSFVEPALTALYDEVPPLLTRPMAHGLLSLLSTDPSTTLVNYRPKVQELCIDADEIAHKTYKGQSLDLGALVSNLPRLKFVQFYHRLDDPPYRTLDAHLRWHYPNSLFRALNGMQDLASQTTRTKLAGWQWNRRMMGHELTLAGIKTIHLTPAFAGLKTVSFVNYQVPSLHAKANADDEELAVRDQAFIQSMADAITALPALERLSFESSTVVNDHLLQLLPKTLTFLELVNCWDINGDDFANYLLSSGYKLKSLVLRHNQSLNLSFLTILGSACPSLQRLSIDLKTFNHHEFYHDGDPSYDDLLTTDQVPDWPQALETLQILHMKKWAAEAAEMFFQSLVDSAPRLLKLRKLEIKAMLSIPIQERSQLRNKWEAKLKQVLLRDQQDPRPFHSLRQLVQQQMEAKSVKSTKKKKRGKVVDDTPERRSVRLAVQWSGTSSRASSVGRDLRNPLGRPSYAEPDTDEEENYDVKGDEDKNGDGLSEESQASSSSTRSASEEPPFLHGMCEKVDIQLDNQKATETTLTMDDFLDSENDDLTDDDWNGEDEDFDEGYAW
ncbi:hypothetical protein N0V88_000423 [Collariella sp. IMI 366227]|nr:hypothetical protein N0V88_000423 [Collariella sp. IMI 366227]